ncbi:complement factor H-related protein 4-like [Centropristis striata]|uniref:complement factor H-related protein 4-like n=1 Tax=Centropristis striata TaxID=184440 RepID=UPI0027DF89B7|nr:complement factor H-related protein 4-like [Centropristis striata]
MTSKVTTRICELNGWSNHVPTCEPVSCDPPTADGRLIVTGLSDNGNPILPRYSIDFSCSDPGSNLIGSEHLVCGEDGQWDDQFPSCEDALTCGKPPYLEDGDITTSSKTEYSHGERVEYRCQNYYTMQGGPYKTCNNGEWTGWMTCLKPCTVDKHIMASYNIRFRYSHEEKLYLSHNDVIVFSCTRGRPVGTVEMRQRCVNGQMDFPTCE